MSFQPGPGALAVVAGEVVGDHLDGALGAGLLGELEEVLVEGAVVGRSAQGDRLAAGDAGARALKYSGTELSPPGSKPIFPYHNLTTQRGT